MYLGSVSVTMTDVVYHTS